MAESSQAVLVVPPRVFEPVIGTSCKSLWSECTGKFPRSYVIATAVCLVWGLTIECAAGAQDADRNQGLELGRVFTDNAVLQRDEVCIVYGRDLPGTTVIARFRDASGTGVADAEGKWRLELGRLTATRTGSMLTVEGSSRKVLRNVVVGDVWLISGQSNADMPLRSAEGGSAAVASATNSLIRLLLMDERPRTDARAWSAAEVGRLNAKDFFTGSWQVCTPAKAGNFSAIGYWFARNIYSNQNVAVGLIDCTVGGTPAASWMPPGSVVSHYGSRDASAGFLDSIRVPEFVRRRVLENLADWDRRGRPSPMPQHPYMPGACWGLGFGELAPFGLRGILWYQGETDADFNDPAQYEAVADRYVETFRVLVEGWRSAWSRPNLPVYFVQLPQMNRASWPWFREAQARCSREVPGTAMAVAFDCGEPENVHPVRKEPVAERLALIARALSYGEELEWSGPVYSGHRIEGSEFVLEFDHVDGGLVSSDGKPLRFFELAAEDGKFHPAAAEISRNTVRVTSPAVPHPVMARYAWVPADSVNLYNGAGLPAAPFRTEPMKKGH